MQSKKVNLFNKSMTSFLQFVDPINRCTSGNEIDNNFRNRALNLKQSISTYISPELP